MFEHWRQVTYFDNESSVFPSDELLEELWIYDTGPRTQVKHALEGLLNDFNQLLLEIDIYDWFYSNHYTRVLSKNTAVLFY